ncbi:carbohydrate binding domain-containing protein [Streptomyces sp. NPDC012888]|uniref:carbohydrate binding domain-containing protein n=1 Tax=Streptomyces sp. NPDC012888 TaxID=3364855 RepID=UPI0036A25156
MIRFVLRAAFGYAATALAVDWTDISQWADLPTGIRCTRGAADELSQIQPSTMTLTLDNSDGRFSPGLSTSPYYPYIRPGCPIQLGIITATTKNLINQPSFASGELGEWTTKPLEPVAEYATDSVRARTGTFSLRMEWANTGTGGVIQQTVYGLDIGRVYTVSGYVWVPAGDPAVRWRVDDGAPGTASTTNDAWERITLSFTATSTSHTVQLTTNTTSPTLGDVAWLDDVQLEQSASATAVTINGAQIHWRFYGAVNQWRAVWDGLHPEVSVSAADLMSYMSRAPQLQSMLTEEMLLLDPIVYYPLSESSTSESGGDIAGDGAGSLSKVAVGSGGTVNFGETDGPPATGQTAPVLSPSSSTVGWRLDADMGAYVEQESTNFYMTYEVWFKTTVADRIFLHLRSADFMSRLSFCLNASGQLTFEHTAVGSTLMVDTVDATNLADGQWHHIAYDEWNQYIAIDGGAPFSGPGISLMYALRYASVGTGTTRLWDGAVAHVAMYRSNYDISMHADHYNAGFSGHSGEDADERILRLAGYAGVASVDANGDFSAVASQGEGGQSALDMMRLVETTESGKLASHRDGHGLLFQSRTVRYNAEPSVTLTYSDLETDSVELPIDDQKLINTVLASRPGGATQRVTSAESIAAFGPYQRSTTILKVTDAEVIDAGYWLVSRYAIPEPELREIPIQAYSLSTAQYRLLLDADISTVIEVTDMPDEAPASTVTATVEGYRETISQESHEIVYHTSRSVIDAVWVLNSTTYSVLGSTTRLGY